MRIWKNGKTHKHPTHSVRAEQEKKAEEKKKKTKNKEQRTKSYPCVQSTPLFLVFFWSRSWLRKTALKNLVFLFLCFFTTLHTFIIFLGKVKYYLVSPVIPGDFNFQHWVTVHHTCVLILRHWIYGFCFIIILFM